MFVRKSQVRKQNEKDIQKAKDEVKKEYQKILEKEREKHKKQIKQLKTKHTKDFNNLKQKYEDYLKKIKKEKEKAVIDANTAYNTIRDIPTRILKVWRNIDYFKRLQFENIAAEVSLSGSIEFELKELERLILKKDIKMQKLIGNDFLNIEEK